MNIRPHPTFDKSEKVVSHQKYSLLTGPLYPLKLFRKRTIGCCFNKQIQSYFNSSQATTTKVKPNKPTCTADRTNTHNSPSNMTLMDRFFPGKKTTTTAPAPQTVSTAADHEKTTELSQPSPTTTSAKSTLTTAGQPPPPLSSISPTAQPLEQQPSASSSSEREPFFSPLTIQITNPFNQTSELQAVRTSEQQQLQQPKTTTTAATRTAPTNTSTQTVTRRSHQHNVHHHQVNRAHSPNMLSHQDFETIRVIGQGSSGQVLLVKHRVTGRVLAMKKMSKSHLLKKNKASQVRLERDVLVHSRNPVCNCFFEVL